MFLNFYNEKVLSTGQQKADGSSQMDPVMPFQVCIVDSSLVFPQRDPLPFTRITVHWEEI